MIEKYFGTEFIKAKYSGLDGDTHVSWTENSGMNDSFVVDVTPRGMTIKGTLNKTIVTEAELQEFAKFISNVWQEHRKLAPKLVRTISGH